MSFHWVLLDAEGNELRSSEAFESREEAESWMGSEWSALRAEGAQSVSLRDDDRSIYEMSLLEA
jgi:hypothetical protein